MALRNYTPQNILERLRRLSIKIDILEKNSGGSGQDGANGALTALTYTFTPAEILTLKATPVEIVAAPGAGKIIKVHSAVMQNVANTTSYDNGEPFVLTVDGAADVFATDNFSIVDGGSDVIKNLVVDSVNETLPYIENAALVATLGAGFGVDATQGDDTISIYITYEVITL